MIGNKGNGQLGEVDSRHLHSYARRLIFTVFSLTIHSYLVAVLGVWAILFFFGDRWWFPRIRSLITMGTPHLGAPKALNQMCGTEGMLGIKPSDLVKLVSDERFPSLYQLVAVQQSALIVQTLPGGALPQTIDPFSDAIAHAVGMKDGPGRQRAAGGK